MSERQVLHRIVDELPEPSLEMAHRLLVKLRDRVFDEDLDPEEAAESDRAWREYLSGEDPGESLDDVRRELLG